MQIDARTFLGLSLTAVLACGCAQGGLGSDDTGTDTEAPFDVAADAFRDAETSETSRYDVDTSAACTDPDDCPDLPNTTAQCESAACSYECRPNYVDLDDDLAANGCECEKTSSTDDPDRPDPSAEDTNCDGLDGTRSRSVFVATTENGGSDSNDGRSTDSPVATISKAVGIANGCSPKCDVLVSAGTYPVRTTLVSGVSIYGGYDPEAWTRDADANNVVLTGEKRRAVVAKSLGSRTVLAGLEIHGADATTKGRSSYAVWVEKAASDHLELRRVRIEAGDGAAGTDGSDVSDAGDASRGGSASGSTPGSAGTSPCGASGGDGGSAWNCGSTSGGNGSAGGDSTGGGGGGIAGDNECGGCADSGGNGGDGGAGDDGADGAGGTAASDTFGRFPSPSGWSGVKGSSGGRGRNGHGGGGGGGGGADQDGIFCGSDDDVGGGGGGGGGGGCGGPGGMPGGAGGGSFGIVLFDAKIRLDRVTVALGSGGTGGAGGTGGNGGAGAPGGNGASGQGEAGDGGDGAEGGDGGGGGGGAGGCGGPAVGIAKVGSASVQKSKLTFESGAGGAGGPGGEGGYRGGNQSRSRADSGAQGCTGGEANTHSY